MAARRLGIREEEGSGSSVMMRRCWGRPGASSLLLRCAANNRPKSATEHERAHEKQRTELSLDRASSLLTSGPLLTVVSSTSEPSPCRSSTSISPSPSPSLAPADTEPPVLQLSSSSSDTPSTPLALLFPLPSPREGRLASAKEDSALNAVSGIEGRRLACIAAAGGVGSVRGVRGEGGRVELVEKVEEVKEGAWRSVGELMLGVEDG